MRLQKHWNFCKEMLARVAPADGSPFYAAEIGCASGGNAASMLRAFPGLHLWMIDPWQADPVYVASLRAARQNSPYLAKVSLSQEDFDGWYSEAIKATAFAIRRVNVCRVSSLVGASRMLDEALSFVFIDGDHREPAVAADLRVWWRKVKAGGIFSGHDYGTRGHDGVKRAVNAWCKDMGVDLRLHPTWARCWWVEKT